MLRSQREPRCIPYKAPLRVVGFLLISGEQNELRSTERSVLSFEVQVSASKAAASPPRMAEIVDVLIGQYEDGRAVMSLNRETATIEILDVLRDEENELVTFLFKYIDQLGSDVSFTNVETKVNRQAAKQEGEGRDFGAHMCLSLTESTNRPNLYPALIERVPGVSSTFISRLLNSIIRTLYKAQRDSFTCDDITGVRHRDGQPKQISFRPLLSFQGLPSDQLVSDLEEGSIQEIQLIKQQEREQFGAQPWLVESQRVVKLEVTNARPGAGALWGDLLGVFRSAADDDGVAQARIRFRRADGQADTIDIDAETGTLLDQRYVKSTIVADIDPPLGECPTGIVAHFADILRDAMIESRAAED